MLSNRFLFNSTVGLLALTPIFNYLANLSREARFYSNGFGGECLLWLIPCVPLVIRLFNGGDI